MHELQPVEPEHRCTVVKKSLCCSSGNVGLCPLVGRLGLGRALAEEKLAALLCHQSSPSPHLAPLVTTSTTSIASPSVGWLVIGTSSLRQEQQNVPNCSSQQRPGSRCAVHIKPRFSGTFDLEIPITKLQRHQPCTRGSQKRLWDVSPDAIERLSKLYRGRNADEKFQGV